MDNLKVLDKVFHRNSGLLEDAGQGAHSDFFVVGNHAACGTTAQYDVTAFLSGHGKAHFLQSCQALAAADPG